MNGNLRRFFKMETAKRVLSKISTFKDPKKTNSSNSFISLIQWSKLWRDGPNAKTNTQGSPFNYLRPLPQNSSLSFWNHRITRHFRRGRSVKELKSPVSPQEELIRNLPPLPPRYTMSDYYRLMFKPLAFTAFIAGSSVVGCTIWQYEDYRRSIAQERRFSLGNFRIPIPGMTQPPRTQSTEIRQRIDSWWTNLSVGEKLFWPICALNTLVYCAWRVPSCAPLMVKYFSATPVSRAICWPMLLSTFSHYSFYHLAANMFVLHSFIPAAAAILGKENFVAMYLTSGVVASYGSHLHKLFIGSNIPSLGASGAIMGILGLVCTRMPDIQLGIIFLPGVQFSADTALKCILAVDVTGILAGWQFMDHAAHLSGCLFGIAFSHFGAVPIGIIRDNVMTFWHKFRTTGLSSDR